MTGRKAFVSRMNSCAVGHFEVEVSHESAGRERVCCVNTSIHHGQWEVQPGEGLMHLQTKRIGIFKINAKAPIVGGFADWTKQTAELQVQIGINEVKTGYSILDPQVRKLVNSGSDGILVFDGTGVVTDSSIDFEGTAKAGDVEVPLTLTGDPGADEADGSRKVSIQGTAIFDDISLPIPGFSHLNSIEIHIDGVVELKKN